MLPLKMLQLFQWNTRGLEDVDGASKGEGGGGMRVGNALGGGTCTSGAAAGAASKTNFRQAWALSLQGLMCHMLHQKQ